MSEPTQAVSTGKITMGVFLGVVLAVVVIVGGYFFVMSQIHANSYFFNK